MEKYNLDDKGGLFKFLVKNPAKVLKGGESVKLKHFNLLSPVDGTVTEVSESTMKVQLRDKTPDLKPAVGDHIVVYCPQSGDYYVVCGEISAFSGSDTFLLSIMVSKIEKLKELKKEKKFNVSFPAQVKIIGVADSKFAAVKAISYGGVKLNCVEDVMLEDIIDVTIQVDKMNKMPFKGRVVRKNKLSNMFEYGVEFAEMVESSNKILTRIMVDFDSM